MNANELRRKARSRIASWTMPLVGLAALVWFLIRVVPKPSRAAYPCQRAAFPLASAFVIWLTGLVGAAALMGRARRLATRSRCVAALACTLAAVGVVWIAVSETPSDVAFGAEAEVYELWTPSDPPNAPMGVGRGVNPGRVVWAHDSKATRWDGENGVWWSDESVDQARVTAMLDGSVQKLAGADTNAAAWNALFGEFNRTHGRRDAGYRKGEKITIKANLNVSSSHGPWADKQAPTPHLMLALLAQLVKDAGVPEECITVTDPSRFVGAPLWDKCHAAFPGVRFVDRTGGDGRVKCEHDPDVAVDFADDDVHFDKASYLARCLTEADYVINFALLRGHSLAGITAGAKNHFGSFWVDWPKAWNNGWAPCAPDKPYGLHGYVNAFEINWSAPWQFPARPAGSYNPLVELMGHEDLGEKTVLFLVDGLYAGHDQGQAQPLRWQTAPFDGHWCSSLLVSQDGVACESVALDFLRSEQQYADVVRGTVDDYLHEAAQADDPPSGSKYDPEGDGTRLKSLGVHEHWNNATDRRYSRNLGRDQGIELVTLPATE